MDIISMLIWSVVCCATMLGPWAWDIPLTNLTSNCYVFASGYLDKDAAETELRAHLGLLDSDVEAPHLQMKVGWGGTPLGWQLSGGGNESGLY